MKGFTVEDVVINRVLNINVDVLLICLVFEGVLMEGFVVAPYKSDDFFLISCSFFLDNLSGCLYLAVTVASNRMKVLHKN